MRRTYVKHETKLYCSSRFLFIAFRVVLILLLLLQKNRNNPRQLCVCWCIMFVVVSNPKHSECCCKCWFCFMSIRINFYISKQVDSDYLRCHLDRSNPSNPHTVLALRLSFSI